MTRRDSLGYLCADPPAWLRVSDTRSRGFGGGNSRELTDDTLAETVEYVLAGHSLQEAGEHFGLAPDSIKHRLRVAGYGYDVTEDRWVVA
jgi:hypothetical protein